MRPLSLLTLFLFALIGCDFSKHPGYSKYESGLYFKRISLGEGTIYHPDSCFLDYSVRFHPLDSTKKEITNTIKFAQLSPLILADSILKQVQKGDKVSFICSDNNLYMNELCKSEDFLDGEWYEVEFDVDEVYNLYLQEEDPNVKEYKSIKLFLSFISSPNLYRYINGIWFKEIDTGSTVNVQGEIVLDYKGFSLEGDSLDIPDYPLQFNTADQYQVIEGIEIALQNMHYGDSTMVIIPSYLAFGELGSKNGNVPPYTALMYHLKAYKSETYKIKE